MQLILLLLSIQIFIQCYLSRRKLISVPILLWIVIFFGAGSGIIPNYLLKNLQLNENTAVQEADFNDGAIFILLGVGIERIPSGTQIPNVYAFSRISKTSELYTKCRNVSDNCKVLISGGDPLRLGISEAEVYKNTLSKMNVAPVDIIEETKSKNTWENAKFSEVILKTSNFNKNIYLITSGIHLRRSLKYFSHFGIKPVPVSADYLASDFSVIPNSYNFALTDIGLHEYFGLARFELYNLLGLNDTKEIN